jgi:hypothetical protein
MAILKSEFSQGNGRLQEVGALTYNTSSQVLSTGASALLALGAAGFSISAHTFLGAATATASAYVGLNDKVASQGYVDEAIAGVVPGIPGDATYLDIASTSAFVAGLASGDLLAFNASGVLALADANGEESSNLIGAFIGAGASPSQARVQVDGEVALSTDLAAFTNGDLVWVAATAGAATSYAALLSGEYATQVGIVSDKANDKVVLQQRIFGQVG